MFERFTDRARRVTLLAEEEARRELASLLTHLLTAGLDRSGRDRSLKPREQARHPPLDLRGQPQSSS